MNENRVQLVSREGATCISISAQITEDGDLNVYGVDYGEAPERVWGADDYEYWIIVPAKEKDKVLLALLEKHYKDNASVVTELKDYLESKSIECQFMTWS